MSLPSIYIINLKRTPERRLNMQRQLDAFGLDYQFVDAIDKLELHSKEYRAQIAHQLGIDESHMENLYNNHIGKGELASKLSHIKVHNLIIRHKIPLACVLEDDGYLRSVFPKILNTPRLLQDLSWDILMLSHIAGGGDALIRSSKNLFRDMLFCRFYKLIRHKEYYPRLLSNWYFVRLIIWKGICYNLRKFFNLRFQYMLSHEIGAIPEMGKSSFYKTGFNRYVSKPNILNGVIHSAMGYILTLPAAIKYKEAALHNIGIIDSVPFLLYRRGKIDLCILSPPCISAIKKYLNYSIRTQKSGAIISQG